MTTGTKKNKRWSPRRIRRHDVIDRMLVLTKLRPPPLTRFIEIYLAPLIADDSMSGMPSNNLVTPIRSVAAMLVALLIVLQPWKLPATGLDPSWMSALE
jgi:hypothetical protein